MNQIPETSQWKERANSQRLIADLHTHRQWHKLSHTYICHKLITIIIIVIIITTTNMWCLCVYVSQHTLKPFSLGLCISKTLHRHLTLSTALVDLYTNY